MAVSDVASAAVGAALAGGHPVLAFLAFLVGLATFGPRQVRPGLAESGLLLQRLALPVVVLCLAGGTPWRQAGAGLAVLAVAVTARALVERRTRQRITRGWGGERALLVGDAEDVKAFAKLVAGYPDHGIRPVATATSDGALPTVLPGGRVADVNRLVRAHGVDHVVVVSSTVADEIGAVFGRERPDGVRLSVLPPLAGILTAGIQVTDLRGLPLISLAPRRTPAGPAWAAKRVFDRTAALLGTLALLPVFALVALAVRIDSPGPVFFRQKRVGRDGKIFEMWKFRSMVVDAEARLDEVLDLNEADGPYFKATADPRVTRVGRFLRRTCIDELPQLFNVVTGSMSLVGPRPFLPSEMEADPEMFRWRLGFLPGMTGPWQVAGRSWLPAEEGLRQDLTYLEHWSLRMDLMILFRTLSVALFGDRHGPVRPELQARISSARYLSSVEGDDLLPSPDAVDISVVIVTHESALDIKPCLDSLLRVNDRATREIIVVDNHSGDGTADIVARSYPEVRLIRKTRRDGFSWNCNVGAAAAAGRHILLLNPDTRTFDGVLDGVTGYLDAHPGVGAVGPKLVYPDGTLQASARRFPRPLATIIRRTPLRLVLRNSSSERRHLMIDEQTAGVRDVDWLLGAAVALRADVLHSIGGLDEGYRLYCEDIDLCWRLHEQGWAVRYMPQVVVEHALSEMTRKRFFTKRTLWHVRSMARFVTHHGFRRPVAPSRARRLPVAPPAPPVIAEVVDLTDVTGAADSTT